MFDDAVCFIAGVDLSHVGQRFGDTEDLSDSFLAGVEKTDRELLDAAENMDAEAYLDVVIRDYDRTRVCGTSSIYTMMQAMDAERGELLKYDQAVLIITIRNKWCHLRVWPFIKRGVVG